MKISLASSNVDVTYSLEEQWSVLKGVVFNFVPLAAGNIILLESIDELRNYEWNLIFRIQKREMCRIVATTVILRC